MLVTNQTFQKYLYFISTYKVLIQMKVLMALQTFVLVMALHQEGFCKCLLTIMKWPNTNIGMAVSFCLFYLKDKSVWGRVLEWQRMRLKGKKIVNGLLSNKLSTARHLNFLPPFLPSTASSNFSIMDNVSSYLLLVYCLNLLIYKRAKIIHLFILFLWTLKISIFTF